MTLPQKDYYCKKCKITFKADYDDSVQRPRRACPKCHKVVDIKITIKGKGQPGVIPPPANQRPPKDPSQPSPILASMTDNELARHRLRMILTNIGSTNREVLDAVGKIINYMDKAGTINIEEQSEKEVLDKFRSQSTQELVNLLKGSSQSEP